MVAPIRSQRSFSALSRSRVRARSGPVWIARAALAADDPDPEAVRVGYAIGKAVGPAVTRNTVRRRLRAIVRDLAPGTWQPGCYLIGVRPGVDRLSFAALTDRVAAAAGALA